MRNLNQQTAKTTQSANQVTGAFQALAAVGIAALAARAARAIGGMAASLVQAASDAEEIRSKFVTTFRGITDAADDTATSLSRNFGLARSEAEKLLANTGDLLTGFGFSRDAALSLSNQVQELAVDLASFTNYSGGAEGASAALTKALLGERESIKSLGIAITEADIAQLAEDKGIVGELTRQQKAALTLEIAIRQSGNAIGDFARTSDSTANQLRQLNQDVIALREEFGNQLKPIADSLIAAARGLVQWFTNLDDQTKQMILTVAAVGTALTVAIGAVTAITIAIRALNAAMVANPALAVVAGISLLVTALSAAIPAIVNARRRHKEYQDQLLNTREALRRLTLDEAQAARARLSGELAEQIRRLNEAHQEAVAVEREIAAIRAEYGDNTAVAERKSLVFQNRLEALNVVVAQETEAFETLRTAVSEADAVIEEMSAEADAAIPPVEELGDVTGEAAAKIKVAGEELHTTSTRLEDATAAHNALVASIREEVAAREKYDQWVADNTVSLDKEKDVIAAVVEERRRAIAAEAAEIEQRRLIEGIDLRNQILGAEREHLDDMRDALHDYLADKVAAEAAAEQAIAEAARQARMQQVQFAQTAAGSILQIVSNLATQEGESARAAAIRNRNIRLAQVAIDTAANVVKVFPDVGRIAAAVALGALQAGAIATTPIPSAAFGGSFTVPEGFNNDSALLRVSSGERVDVSPAGQGGGMPESITLYIGGEAFDARVERSFNQGTAQIRRRGAVRATR